MVQNDLPLGIDLDLRELGGIGRREPEPLRLSVPFRRVRLAVLEGEEDVDREDDLAVARDDDLRRVGSLLVALLVLPFLFLVLVGGGLVLPVVPLRADLL